MDQAHKDAMAAGRDVVFTPEQIEKFEKFDKTVGHRLRAFRVQKGLTAELSALRISDMGYPCGLAKLRRVESGRLCRHWTVMLQCLCKLYNVTPNQVYDARVERVIVK